ncbi:hypothetical protein GCM10022278_00940 [Allohahella marinimesophila]|uniref:YjiS-like domain-containing protein n=2 Tax=Allohahella marinimesophila TaxID=1054972 RepID=A0ABP7NFR9_9GAMM
MDVVRALAAHYGLRQHEDRIMTLFRALKVIKQWYRRSRERDELRRLSPHLMKDIGLRQCDIIRETSKHFWQR